MRLISTFTSATAAFVLLPTFIIPSLARPVSNASLYSLHPRTLPLPPRAAEAGGDLQTFTGSLGAAPVPVTNSGDSERPFEVEGDTFVNLSAALQRSCDVQFNACANSANASGNKGSLTVQACSSQEGELLHIYTSYSPFPFEFPLFCPIKRQATLFLPRVRIEKDGLERRTMLIFVWIFSTMSGCCFIVILYFFDDN